MDWIDCKDKLPEMKYNEKMDYWYSETVKTWTDSLVGTHMNPEQKMQLRGHQKDQGGWGSCIGGLPDKWKPISN